MDNDNLNTYVLPPIEVVANRDYTNYLILFLGLIALVGLRK